MKEWLAFREQELLVWKYEIFAAIPLLELLMSKPCPRAMASRIERDKLLSASIPIPQEASEFATILCVHAPDGDTGGQTTSAPAATVNHVAVAVVAFMRTFVVDVPTRIPVLTRTECRLWCLASVGIMLSNVLSI